MHIERSEGSWLRRLGYGGAAAGMILAFAGLTASPASATPQGNNGTIKVDEQGVENGPGAPNSNDPHIECVGRIEWYGFDPGVQTADVLFEVWNPTAKTGAPGAPTEKSYLDVKITDGDGPGGTSLDGTLDFDLTDLLASYTPHPKQGYHVKVTASTTFAQGNDTKSKVFWVAPCPGLPTPPTGSLEITKDVDGNDPQPAGTLFDFAVDCALGGQAVDLDDTVAGVQGLTFTLADGATRTLADLPTGATCTVEETGDAGAHEVRMQVDKGPLTLTSSVDVVVGDATTVEVLTLNTFTAVAVVPPVVVPPVVTAPVVLPEVITPPVIGPPVVTPPVVAPVVTPPVAPPVVLPEVITPEVTPPVVLPELITPEVPVAPGHPQVVGTTAQPQSQVLGNVVGRSAQLPRTGNDALPLLELGLGMVLLGAGAVLFGRERTALS